MWFRLLWKTKLFDRPIAELLSEKIIVVPSYSWHKSLNTFLIQTVWHVVSIPMPYLAFSANNDIIYCFLEA